MLLAQALCCKEALNYLEQPASLFENIRTPLQISSSIAVLYYSQTQQRCSQASFVSTSSATHPLKARSGTSEAVGYIFEIRKFLVCYFKKHSSSSIDYSYRITVQTQSYHISNYPTINIFFTYHYNITPRTKK